MCRCDECKLNAYSQKVSFEGWKKIVDAFVLAETGKTTEEMPDRPWWKWWHEEETPRAAVDMAKEDWGIG